jgi:hypothetical protein
MAFVDNQQKEDQQYTYHQTDANQGYCFMPNRYRIIWTISTLTSAIFLFCTGYIIYHFANTYTPDPSQLTTEKELTEYLSKNLPKTTNGFGAPILVPTGLFVNSMYFIGPYNVHMSGYIWQKYDDTSMHIKHKIMEFPEGVEVELKESYRRMIDGVLTIGWHFEGQFIQNFDYFDFPMDNKIAWLRMWHTEDDKNVILVPDLASYDSTKAGDRFGIDPEIVLTGFTIPETYFNYQKRHYDTNFGISKSAGIQDFPELYFNIALKRNVINSAIVYFLPLATAIILMFFGILLITTRPDHLSFLGYNLINLLSLAAFLIFIVVLSHIQLRSQVTSETVIYLEYIYIIVYMSIVYAIGAAFIIDHASQLGFTKICSNDGLWAKATFLPLVTLAFYLATYFSF